MLGITQRLRTMRDCPVRFFPENRKKIEDAMLRIKNGFITAETGTKESLENQVKNMQSNYEAMQKAVEDGTPGVTQQMVDSAKQMVDSAKAELDKLQPQAEESTKKAGEKAKQGLASQKPAIDATSKEIARLFQ